MKENLHLLEKYFEQTIDIIDHDSSLGKFNMDYDFELLEKVKNGGNASFRLYSWKPWCLSLGNNQKDDDILYNKIKELDYQTVRRPTGGRAVFHANELTYSIAIKLTEKVNHRYVYQKIHEILADSFNDLNLVTSLEKSGTDLNEHYKQAGKSSLCFASSARYEIEHNGRKIVGSAQRLFGDTLLQHGSILIGPEHLQIIDLVNSEDPEKLKNFLMKKSISLNEISDQKIDVNILKKSILNRIG